MQALGKASYYQLKCANTDVETEVIEISNSNTANHVSKPELDDNQKRWLIVGICMNSVVAPALRKHAGPRIENEYKKLKSNNSIHIQTQHNVLKSYHSYNLKYESINNNARAQGRGYDYSIKNAVDFSKLFVQPHMAKYTGFDDSCDMSALLAFLINLPSIFPVCQKVADQVRNCLCLQKHHNPSDRAAVLLFFIFMVILKMQCINRIHVFKILPNDEIQGDHADDDNELCSSRLSGFCCRCSVLKVSFNCKVRRDIRNKWAHCDLAEWNDINYLHAFQLMNQLLKNLQLKQADEKRLLADLSKWEKYGIHFLQGTTIDLELLRILKKETKALAIYAKDLASSVEDAFKNAQLALETISKELTLRIDQIEHKQKAHDESIKILKQNVDELEDGAVHTKDKLEKIERRLSEDRADINTIKQSVFSKPEGKPLFYPPNKIDVFVGRKWELQKLSECANSDQDHQHVDVISGLGGCGKTTLAVEYAWNYHETYPAGVFWMSADSDESLDSSILKLSIDVDIVGSEFKDTFYKLLKWLSSLEQRWLLVIDNLDRDELSRTAKELISGVWQRGSRGHTIVTTRRAPKDINEEFQIKEEHCLVVDCLSKEQSIDFLQLRSGRRNDCEKDSLEELANELAGLPLALEQAAAHVKNLNCTFQEYTKKFKAKRLKLLKSAKSSYETEKLRLAVQTTWLLNFEYILKQSEEEDLGDAAYTVMQISSFLNSDLIPVEIFNSGEPSVADESLKTILSDSVDVKQIIAILTRFSLFQQIDAKLLSVHRLVQEVIRDSITDKEHQYFILESAMRMINSALQTTTKPHEMLHIDLDSSKRRGALHLWSLLAVNSSSLKSHVQNFVRVNTKFQYLLLKIESAYLCQTSAIYHSVHQRQDQALAEQAEMLSVLSSIDIPEEQCNELTSIKLPLLAKDRQIFQDCMASTQENYDHKDGDVTVLDTETLREKGNYAFQRKEYSNAIQYYSEAIRSSTDSVDWRLLSNRSLAYLKLHDYAHALADADNCIKRNPDQFKAFCWKAYAIAGLIKENKLQKPWECVGMAAASVAAKLNPEVLLEYQMKICYPLVLYTVLEPEDNLNMKIQTLLERPFMSLLLKKGIYKLENCVTSRSVQVIGIEDGVRIQVHNFLVNRLPDMCYKIKTEKNLSVHFENVCFEGNSSVVVSSPNVSATFVKCTFLTGKKACKKFPYCDFGEGCVDPEKCKNNSASKPLGLDTCNGIAGFPGLCCSDQGKVFLDKCTFDRCGGGGTLVDGDGSYLEIKNSTVQNCHQQGVEAREGGEMHVQDNFIVNNQTHGVAVGPKGNGIVSGNFIIGNGNEGILACGKISMDSQVFAHVAFVPEDVSRAEIRDNRIAQNGLSGISLDGGIYKVIGNSVFENSCWGIMIKSRSSAQILNNDIFENKCGGIRVGWNYSAPVYIDGNTIRDHNGPPLYILPTVTELSWKGAMLRNSEEVTIYTKPPIISSRNLTRNNNRMAQHFIQAPPMLTTCNYCHENTSHLKSCAKCKRAKYCSKDCQINHWKRHKSLCRILKEKYTVEVNMSDTKPCLMESGTTFRTFDASLENIGKAPPVDRKGAKKFIVKIQGVGYTRYDPQSYMKLYDQGLSIDIMFKNAAIYNLLAECGSLAADMLTTKKLFMWASFTNSGQTLCLYTDSLPEYQKW